MAKTYLGAGSSGILTTANQTSFWYLAGAQNKSTTEANHEVKFRFAGILSDLAIRLIGNNITGTNTFNTRKNGADGGQSISIGPSATGWLTDSTGTDTVSSTDRFCYSHVPPATGVMTCTANSCVFSADTDTVTRVTNLDNVSHTTASQTTFHPLIGATNNAGLTTETFAKCRMRKAGTFQNFGCYVSSNRATASTLRIRKNAANGNGTVTITGGGAVGWDEDTTSTDTVGSGEDWNWSLATGTGADSLVVQSMCCDFVSTNSDGIICKSSLATSTTFADNTTRFTAISGAVSNITTEADCKQDIMFDCDLSDYQVLCQQNDVSSASTVTLRRNGADTTLSVSITGNTTGLFADNTTLSGISATDDMNSTVIVPAVAGGHTISLANIIIFTNVPPPPSFVQEISARAFGGDNIFTNAETDNRPMFGN